MHAIFRRMLYDHPYVFKYMLFIGVMSDVGSIRSWLEHSHEQAVMLLNKVDPV